MSSRVLFSSGFTSKPTISLICTQMNLLSHQPIGLCGFRTMKKTESDTGFGGRIKNFQLTISQWRSLIPGLQMVVRMGTCCLNWSTFPLKVLATRRGPGRAERDLVSLCRVLHMRSSSSAIFSASRLAKGPAGQFTEGGHEREKRFSACQSKRGIKAAVSVFKMRAAGHLPFIHSSDITWKLRAVVHSCSCGCLSANSVWSIGN